MELVGILRLLARHRGLIACGIVLAVILGMWVAFKVSVSPPGLASRARDGFTASTRVLVQVDDSPTVELDTEASVSLGERARLIGDLMATDRIRADIARRAGLPLEQLTVIAPSTYAVPVVAPIANEANAAALAVAARYRLLVDAGGTIPILSLKAATPNRTSARRLVVAAAAGLNRLVASGPPGLSTTQLGKPRTLVERQSSKVPVAIAAMIAVFGGWCLGVIILGRLLERRRSGDEAPHERGRLVSDAW